MAQKLDNKYSFYNNDDNNDEHEPDSDNNDEHERDSDNNDEHERDSDNNDEHESDNNDDEDIESKKICDYFDNLDEESKKNMVICIMSSIDSKKCTYKVWNELGYSLNRISKGSMEYANIWVDWMKKSPERLEGYNRYNKAQRKKYFDKYAATHIVKSEDHNVLCSELYDKFCEWMHYTDEVVTFTKLEFMREIVRIGIEYHAFDTKNKKCMIFMGVKVKGVRDIMDIFNEQMANTNNNNNSQTKSDKKPVKKSDKKLVTKTNNKIRSRLR
jgi:hypothetical protein